MRIFHKNLWTLALLLVFGCGLLNRGVTGAEIAAQASAPEPVFTPILTQVLAEPIAFAGSDGRWHLVYELELGNQVLGRVGNSGNSLAPHLHMQVMDAPSGLVANGLPYVFKHFRITGIDEAGTADFDRAEETGEPATITPVQPPNRHTRELPLDLTVVDWLND